MSEPQRGTIPDGAPPGEPGAAGRDARIEQLLLSGLDCYFAGHYEQAIDIWTRVSFLDRGHGRARAYIERARSAIAERQRESEELLHQGVAAFQEGRLDVARTLLARAVEHGGPSDAALALVQGLRRLEAVAVPPATVSRRAFLGRGRGAVVPASREGVRWVPTMLACLAAVTIVAAAASSLTSFLAERAMADAGSQRPALLEPLPVPEPSEGVLRRARVLHAAGRSREALRLLESVRLGDPLGVEIDRLREDIERTILSLLDASAALPPVGEAPR
jgi:hypothetical protein